MLIDFQKTATKIQYTNLLDMIRNKTIFQTFVFKPKSFFYSLFSIFFLHFSILYTDFNHSHGFFLYIFLENCHLWTRFERRLRKSVKTYIHTWIGFVFVINRIELMKRKIWQRWRKRKSLSFILMAHSVHSNQLELELLVAWQILGRFSHVSRWFPHSF